MPHLAAISCSPASTQKPFKIAPLYLIIDDGQFPLSPAATAPTAMPPHPLALQAAVSTPGHVRSILARSQSSWLSNEDIHDLLTNWEKHGLKTCTETPNLPPGRCSACSAFRVSSLQAPTSAAPGLQPACCPAKTKLVSLKTELWGRGAAREPLGKLWLVAEWCWYTCPGHAGGALFLFNRNVVRSFRKDGHDWRKKTDGRSVRETHEKLK